MKKQKKKIIIKILNNINMPVLKQIKFGKSISEIQFTEVKPANGGVITATPSHTESTDVNNPEYAID